MMGAPLTTRQKLEVAQGAYQDLSLLHKTMAGPVLVPMLATLESIICDMERIDHGRPA